MSDAELHRRAERFVVRALKRARLRAEALGGHLLVAVPSGRSTMVRVLMRQGPHRRGGGLNLGLHWMLGATEAEHVALVDLTRRRGWLLPLGEFCSRARPVAGGRFHLDWIVARLGTTRTKIADEAEFAPYAFDESLPQLARRLAVDRGRRRA